jgi:DNA-binding NarL/FixJ family response regulator
MSKALEIVWVDDDSPRNARTVENATVHTAQSVAGAEQKIKTLQRDPDWIIVDVVLPQAGWHGDRFYVAPGIEYVRHLAEKRCSSRIAVYSIALTPDRERQAIEAGAVAAFDKHAMGLGDVVRKLQSLGRCLDTADGDED